MTKSACDCLPYTTGCIYMRETTFWQKNVSCKICYKFYDSYRKGIFCRPTSQYRKVFVYLKTCLRSTLKKIFSPKLQKSAKRRIATHKQIRCSHSVLTRWSCLKLGSTEMRKKKSVDSHSNKTGVCMCVLWIPVCEHAWWTHTHEHTHKHTHVTTFSAGEGVLRQWHAKVQWHRATSNYRSGLMQLKCVINILSHVTHVSPRDASATYLYFCWPSSTARALSTVYVCTWTCRSSWSKRRHCTHVTFVYLFNPF